MTDNQKISAAIAAVMYYLNEEQAIVAQTAMSAMQTAPAAGAPIPGAVGKPWGMSGRQAQMQMGILMQMRTFQRNSSF